MPLSLPEMVAQWQIVSTKWIMPASGTGPTVEANPLRLALGFSYNPAKLAAVFPVVPDGDEFDFYLNGADDRWFHWHKHAAIIALPWRFTNFGTGIDSITTIEIFQAQPR